MILYDLNMPDITEEIIKNWKSFSVEVYYDEHDSENKYNLSKESDYYFKKYCDYAEKIECNISDKKGKKCFSYIVDMSKPKADFMGILEIKTEVVVIDENGNEYEGEVWDGTNNPTKKECRWYFNTDLS